MAERKQVKRTSTYLGPEVDIEPDELCQYESKHAEEPKVDGMWCELTVGDPKNGVPHTLNSRDALTEPISGANLGDLHEVPLPFKQGTRLIGELEAATQWAKDEVKHRGFRRLHVFDVIQVGDNNYTELQWIVREKIRREMIEALTDDHAVARFLNVPYVRSDFKGWYKRWIDEGYEGTVIKPFASLYKTTRADGKTREWLRCKKWVTGDYVLMGLDWTEGGKYSKPQRRGIWGLFKENKKSGVVELTEVMRGASSLGEEVLCEKNVGKLVVEFKGWVKFRSGALRHAQAVRVREDKSPRLCTL